MEKRPDTRFGAQRRRLNERLERWIAAIGDEFPVPELQGLSGGG